MATTQQLDAFKDFVKGDSDVLPNAFSWSDSQLTLALNVSLNMINDMLGESVTALTLSSVDDRGLYAIQFLGKYLLNNRDFFNVNREVVVDDIIREDQKRMFLNSETEMAIYLKVQNLIAHLKSPTDFVGAS